MPNNYPKEIMLINKLTPVNQYKRNFHKRRNVTRTMLTEYNYNLLRITGNFISKLEITVPLNLPELEP